MIGKKSQLKKKRTSSENVLEKDINTQANTFERNRERINEFCDILAKQMW